MSFWRHTASRDQTASTMDRSFYSTPYIVVLLGLMWWSSLILKRSVCSGGLVAICDPLAGCFFSRRELPSDNHVGRDPLLNRSQGDAGAGMDR